MKSLLELYIYTLYVKYIYELLVRFGVDFGVICTLPFQKQQSRYIRIIMPACE
jgi:hypothetical protein